MTGECDVPNRTIYALDDDAGFRSSMHAIADSLGIRCETFESLDDFLSTKELARPACLVLDHSLKGGMKGVEAFPFLERANWRIPVIVCTAYATVPLAVQYMRAGALSFVEKPLQGHQMANQILEAIQHDSQNLKLEHSYLAMRRRYNQLTPRQKAILGMMSECEIYKSIADKLDVSRRTLDLEKAMIYRTLEVDSQLGLGIWITRILSLRDSLGMHDAFPELDGSLGAAPHPRIAIES